MRIRALVIRISRQFLRDKRTLALMIAAPLLILWLMSLVFHDGTYNPKLGLVQIPEQFSINLRDLGAELTTFSAAEANQALNKGEIDAIISLSGSAMKVTLEGSDPAKNRSVLFLLQKATQTNRTETVVTSPSLAVTYLHGSEQMASIDNFGPVLIGFFAFFFVFIISGVAFLKERTSGTLERLLATPLKRWEIVVGYVLGFGIFTMLQACLIAWFSIYVLGLLMVGSFWLVLIMIMLMSLTALTLGTFLSAFANTEFQMIQFIPLVVVPQVFFSGLFNLDQMAPWMQWLSKIMPLRYGADALSNIMIRGKGWDVIAFDVYLLLGLSLFFMAANVLALRKHRKI